MMHEDELRGRMLAQSMWTEMEKISAAEKKDDRSTSDRVLKLCRGSVQSLAVRRALSARSCSILPTPRSPCPGRVEPPRAGPSAPSSVLELVPPPAGCPRPSRMPRTPSAARRRPLRSSRVRTALPSPRSSAPASRSSMMRRPTGCPSSSRLPASSTPPR